jgi:hypothetical protein
MMKTWDETLFIGNRPGGADKMCRLMTGRHTQGGQGATPQREPFGNRSTVPFCRVVERPILTLLLDHFVDLVMDMRVH